jgi:hypothetical protein
MWYIRLQELTIKVLKMTYQFLKPYILELIDTLFYMIKGFISFIISLLPKQQLVYSWRLKRVIPNVRKYFLLILVFYFVLHVGISKVRANETFVMPKVEMTEEEKGHDNALYKKVVKDIDDLNNKQTYELSRTITPKESANQNCYVSVKITQEGDSVVKKEILECADGRKGLITPSYWEMFAQFYYRDVSAPEYCRYYSRPDHAFKSFGKTCLNKNGEWRVQ